MNSIKRGLHGDGTEFFLQQIMQVAYSSLDPPYKVDRMRQYLARVGLLYDPQEYNDEQAMEIVASV